MGGGGVELNAALCSQAANTALQKRTDEACEK